MKIYYISVSIQGWIQIMSFNQGRIGIQIRPGENIIKAAHYTFVIILRCVVTYSNC